MAKTKPAKKTITGNKKIFWSVIGFLSLVFIVSAFLFIQYVSEGLPSLEQLENPKQTLASTVFSADGVEIGQFFKQNRVEVNIDSVPGYLINALIATEDRDFYDHWGVDFERFVKAMFKTVFLFKREGASTITQQLAKNLYDLKIIDETAFDTVVRKIREWITAIQIEKTYTKKEIIEMYLNTSYFGKGAYGVESAAKIYFDKQISNLTIPDCAVLVALLKSSVRYDPSKNYDRSLQRRNLVMYNMLEMDFITREEYDAFKVEPITLSQDKLQARFRSVISPHYVEYVRQQMALLENKYGFDLYEDGLTIYTSLDTRMQKAANKAVTEHLMEFQKQFDSRWSWNNEIGREVLKDHLNRAIRNSQIYKTAEKDDKKSIYELLKNDKAFVDSVKRDATTIEVGFVVLDVKSGEIKAMVGGRDLDFAYGLNHATQISRQPGSSFKPIIYTVALDNGLYPAFPILNQPFNFNGWEPQNFDKSTGDFITLREGLKNSLNLISARLIIEDHVQLYKVGLYAQRMGIKSKLDLYPSIALGTSGVSPIELTSAYATIANHGIYNEPISILKIENKDGIIVDNFYPHTSEAIPEETAYMMINMMETVINEGSGLRVRSYFRRPAAGKTGTTQEFGDAWFVGFTPQLAAGVWVGFDDNRIKFSGNYGQGARAALPIWGIFMKEVYETIDMPLETFEPPSNGNVVPVQFCKESIFELGDPKLMSNDCNTGSITDIINLKDIPRAFNSDRDTTIKIFDKYMAIDSSAHEAFEIE